MAKKKAADIHQRSPSPPSDDTKFVSPLEIPSVEKHDRVPVKVNNASMTELKLACDDSLKRYLTRPQLFTQNHQHTDVKLALGWAAVLVAGATGFYTWKVEFEDSKPVLWVGMITYVLLTTLQTLYVYFIEGSTVFMGKRKTLAKRIITERLTILSTALPPTSTSSSPSLSSLLSVSLSLPPNTNPSPEYQLTLSYIRTTSKNKHLLAKGKVVTRGGHFNLWFDEEGVFDEEAFERWVGGWVEGVMEGKAL